MSKYLLIGGPNDGERHELPEGLGVYRVVDTSRASVAEPFHESSTYSTVLYRPMQLAADKERFTVYLCDGVTPAEAMRRLIENYHVQASFATLPER